MMHSTNGKLKSNKEEATKTKEFKSKVTCNDCGFTEERSAVFGEVSKCSLCQSFNVVFTYK